jgi:hypothetical protein
MECKKSKCGTLTHNSLKGNKMDIRETGWGGGDWIDPDHDKEQ